MCWLLSPTHTKRTMTYYSFTMIVTLAIFARGVLYVAPCIMHTTTNMKGNSVDAVVIEYSCILYHIILTVWSITV